jgi:hypothetical protein
MSEWRIFTDPDVRVAGFGPLFSAALVLSIFNYVYIIFLGKFQRTYFIYGIVCLFLIVISLVTPNSWWLRYAPYLWLVPVLLTLATLVRYPHKKNCISWIVITILIINSLVISVVIFKKNFNESFNSRLHYLDSLRVSSISAPISLDCSFNQDLIDFREAGIKFYCNKIGKDIFKFYINQSGNEENLIDLYVSKINNANLNGNYTKDDDSKNLFYGVILYIRPNISHVDIDKLTSIYSLPLKYKTDPFFRLVK